MNQDKEDETNPEKETERIFQIMDKNKETPFQSTNRKRDSNCHE